MTELRVVPDMYDDHYGLGGLICGIVVAVMMVPWWVGLWTIIRWVLR